MGHLQFCFQSKDTASSGFLRMLSEEDPVARINCHVAQCYGHPGIPCQALIGTGPLVFANALDERAASLEIRVPFGALRNMNRCSRTTVRQFGAQARAGQRSVLEDELLGGIGRAALVVNHPKKKYLR